MIFAIFYNSPMMPTMPYSNPSPIYYLPLSTPFPFIYPPNLHPYICKRQEARKLCPAFLVKAPLRVCIVMHI
jgi:hypothetical protein